MGVGAVFIGGYGTYGHHGELRLHGSATRKRVPDCGGYPATAVAAVTARGFQVAPPAYEMASGRWLKVPRVVVGGRGWRG